jgi:deoxyribodipyrimidine photo-lyase
MRVFLFHKDLRLTDNTTLIMMSKATDEPIVPIFIFTEQQINPKKNLFFGSNCVQFMIESLYSLNKEIKQCGGELYYFRAKDTITALEKINKLVSITELGSNYDYSPFAIKRDKLIKKFCDKKKIKFYQNEDLPLHNLLDETCLKKDLTPYKVFTPFRNEMWKKEVRKVDKYNKFLFKKNTILKKESYTKLDTLYTENKNILVHGGRDNGIFLLKKIKEQKHYAVKRDCLTYNTTFLGSYLSFGVLSCREVYHEVRKQLGKHTALESELYWALFYQMIMYYFPRVIKGHFKEKWDNIKYTNNKKYINALLNCKTGFPIIDAGLKQLLTTGFSHNRMRMVLTSFMAKHMQLNPLWIEKWWANYLVDYNVAATNGGVSWVCGYGTDAMIANRIFNPWTQSQKFDPDSEFIKKWLPELKAVESKHLHNWEDTYVLYPNLKYSKPIFKHTERRKEYIKFLKKNKI